MEGSRDLTLMIVKSLGLSQLICLASVIDILEEITPLGKTKLWKNKKDKIKRGGDKGGLCITDNGIIFKAL